METRDYKEETASAYDRDAERFDAYFEAAFKRNVQPLADEFLNHLKGKKILDLGSGPGNHGAYFKSKGFEVMCVDLSEEFVKRCRQRGLQAQVMDLEHLDFTDESFDGIWAYASLLHLKKKVIPEVIRKIASMLRPSGMFGLALKEGTTEGFESTGKFSETRRWFTHVQDQEVRKWCWVSFDIVSATRTTVSEEVVFLNYLMRKR